MAKQYVAIATSDAISQREKSQLSISFGRKGGKGGEGACKMCGSRVGQMWWNKCYSFS